MSCRHYRKAVPRMSHNHVLWTYGRYLPDMSQCHMCPIRSVATACRGQIMDCRQYGIILPRILCPVVNMEALCQGCQECPAGSVEALFHVFHIMSRGLKAVWNIIPRMSHGLKAVWNIMPMMLHGLKAVWNIIPRMLHGLKAEWNIIPRMSHMEHFGQGCHIWPVSGMEHCAKGVTYGLKVVWNIVPRMSHRGSPTRMEYLCYISCLRYTILVGNPRYMA